MKNKIQNLLKITKSKYFKEIINFFTLEGNVRFSPSSLSFYLILSTIPVLTIIATILGFFNNNIFDFFEKYNLHLLLSEELYIRFKIFFANPPTNEKIPFIITFSIITYLSSKGLYYFIYAYNKIYEENTLLKFSLKRKILSIIITLLLEILLAFFIVFQLYFSNLFSFKFLFLTHLIQAIISLIFLFIFISFIYSFSRIDHQEKKPIFLGSLCSSILIFIGSILYNFYLTKISKTLTYFGPLSNLFLLILIIYFASYSILLGVEVNKKFT